MGIETSQTFHVFANSCMNPAGIHRSDAPGAATGCKNQARPGAFRIIMIFPRETRKKHPF
jgi:hypothetical protein